MKKSTNKSRTGRTWKVAAFNEALLTEPKLNEKIIHEQNRCDLYDAFTYCLADVRITEYLYHLEVLRKLKRKLIKHAAMLTISLTTLVMDLSIFFGWWV